MPDKLLSDHLKSVVDSESHALVYNELLEVLVHTFKDHVVVNVIQADQSVDPFTLISAVFDFAEKALNLTMETVPDGTEYADEYGQALWISMIGVMATKFQEITVEINGVSFTGENDDG